MKLRYIAPVSLVGLVFILTGLMVNLPSRTPESGGTNKVATLIHNVRLVHPPGVLSDPVSLLLQDGVVHGIEGKLEEKLDNQQALIVDGDGLVALPGLIDSHTHSYGSALTDAARFGVTTVLDMFTDHRGLKQTKQARDNLAMTTKADLFSAGMLATVAGGHGTQFGVPVEPLSSPSDAMAWVAARKAEGSDYIKLVYMPGAHSLSSIDAATAKAVIDAGHAADLLVVVHISTFDAAVTMIDAGIDGLVHIFADREATDAIVTKAKARGVFIIPTLAVIAGIDGDRGIDDLASSNAVLLSSAQKQSLATSFGVPAPGFSLEIAMKNVQRFHAAGVPILAGADAPNPRTAHGLSLHHELQLLVRAGLSPVAALTAATKTPAKVFELAGRGELAVGARADLLTTFAY